MKPTVVLENLDPNADIQTLKEQIMRSIGQLSIEESFNKASAVFIKPNLTYPHYKQGVTTRQEFIEGLVAALREINDSTMIYIGEGEGCYEAFSMTEAFVNMGFFELEKKYPRVKVINLSEMPARDIEISTAKGPHKVKLPEIFFDEIDFSISCPVPKVHCLTTLSLSFKNIWGCLPDVMRLKNHYMFDYIIAKISSELKFRYAFLDGRYGLTNNGPMVGDPFEVNWFAASDSLGAFDAIVSEMMGFEWQKVRHLKMTGKAGLIPDRGDIKIIGDMGGLKKGFKLKREFWNYPALVAFHSKTLTNLVYLSDWAKPIHDIMYTFRKRPIDD